LKDGVLIVMFDLPMDTPLKIKNYNIFRKSLIKDGYIKMQNSIYLKYIRNLSLISYDINHIKICLPKQGEIKAIQLTLKQFKKIHIILGSKLNIRDNKNLILI